jgi:hypothetical protein
MAENFKFGLFQHPVLATDVSKQNPPNFLCSKDQILGSYM